MVLAAADQSTLSGRGWGGDVVVIFEGNCSCVPGSTHMFQSSPGKRSLDKRLRTGVSGALSRPDDLDDVFISCGMVVVHDLPASFQYYRRLPQDQVMLPSVAAKGQHGLAP